MKRMIALGAALALATSIAGAQGSGHGQGGTTGGGHGQGGMMGGGHGQGMMGGGHGQGMMGGGHGQGMMGGGHGAGGPLAGLDLTDAQREKVLAIQEDHRKKNWTVMGEVRAEQFKLRNLYRSETLDPDKLAAQQQKVDELRRQMVKSRAQTHNQIVAVLTPEQRKQLRQSGPWWARDED